LTTTTQLRSWWSPACTGPFTTVSLHGAGRVTVRSSVVHAVKALNAVLVKHDYRTRAADTGGYNCRKITGGTGWSLHAYGTAIDLNWLSNPYGPTLITDMSWAMVAEIKAIRTNSGQQVWRWGGDYAGNKDAMHFEVVCHPADLATGIRTPKPEPVPEPIPEPEDDDVRRIIKGDQKPEWYLTDGLTKRHIKDRAEAATLAFNRLGEWDDGEAFVWPQAQVDRIKVQQ
jgi:hypothetical protein